MSKEYYALKRICNGKEVFISRDDMDETTTELSDALYFFNENHTKVWRKGNPKYVDAVPVKITEVNGEIVSVEKVTDEEVDIEVMTRKFIKRQHNNQMFYDFANLISGHIHSDKWSLTYDWMHENFVFYENEDDGKIITKFVELIESNRL